VAFTYEFPDARAFLHTLREVLIAEGNPHAAGALIGAECEFSGSTQFSHIRWDSFHATLIIRVPATSIPKFTDELRADVQRAAAKTFPSEAGYELTTVEISALLMAPPDDEGTLNAGRLTSDGPIEHDGLRFRSRSEIRVYDELKKRDVLFFPNATAVLGGRGIKREPDFLVCQQGRWGILEVMGEPYHTPRNAVRDHDRARLFQDYRIFLIQFYDAGRCYNEPASVVDDFLRRLSAT